jgi:hypothetical protein
MHSRLVISWFFHFISFSFSESEIFLLGSMESPSKRSWNVPIVGGIVKMLSPRRQSTEKSPREQSPAESHNAHNTTTGQKKTQEKPNIPPIVIGSNSNETPRKNPSSARKSLTPSKSPRKGTPTSRNTPRSPQQKQLQQQPLPNKRCWNICIIC